MDENASVTDPPVASIDARLVAALNGEPLEVTDAGVVDSLVRRARFHGVELLLLHRAAVTDPVLAGPMRESALAFAAWEMQHRRVVATALRALEQAGVAALVFKGTALASFLYEDPALRTRADTDLLVPAGSDKAVTQALLRSGFHRVPGVPSYQSTFTVSDPAGTSHSLDVHWRINNSELLARTFTFEELADRSMPLPGLAPGARGPSVVDSLMIACMHRATHRHYAYRVDGDVHHDPDRLIWLYDIHLLAGQLSIIDWGCLSELSRAKELRTLVAEGLALAHELFGTAVPEKDMQDSGARADIEAPSRYLASSAFVRGWMDLRAMPGWSIRWRRLRDICLPPSDYVRAKYVGSTIRCLPCLYARRAIEGAWRRVRAFKA